MAVDKILTEIRESLGLSRPKLSHILGFQFEGYVWLLETKGKHRRNPSINTCKKIILLYKKATGKELTIDELLRESEV